LIVEEVMIAPWGATAARLAVAVQAKYWVDPVPTYSTGDDGMEKKELLKDQVVVLGSIT
jgi:hypothetical protein